jgi:hypothetical protein
MDAGRTRSRDVVGTFLEAVGTPVQRTEQRNPPVPIHVVATGPAPGTAAASAEVAEGEGHRATETDAGSEAPRSAMYLVLNHLEGTGMAPMTDLASDLDMPLLEVAGLLSKLSSTGLVAVEGEPGRENVVLTDAGRTIAELA